MDLFKLRGVIEVDNTDANKKLDETSEHGGKAQSKLSGAFSKIGKGAAVVGKAVAGGMVAAGTAIGGLVAQSTSAYAEYEQLVGGVDTLFKDASKKVQGYAANAYKTAGLSANAYMDTVTSFSASMLQSLSGDTQKAAEYSNQAVIDMSDNANKMGTSMQSIQNAYQGFAKQNYTMLDNLKLGYGGTKGEMERLLVDAAKLDSSLNILNEDGQLLPYTFADITKAIHVIQTEMGITGTTAVEAEGTITGSMASVKASWTNLVTAMASDELDLSQYINNFVQSVKGVASNMLPRIKTALNGAVSLIQELAPVVIGAVPDILSQVLPSVITAAVELINTLVDILPSLIDMLVNDLLPQVISGFTTVVNAVISALPSVIEAIASALPTLLPQLIEALISMIVTLCENLPLMIQPIIDNLPTIIESVATALLSNVDTILKALIDLAVALIPMIPEVLLILLEAITETLPELFGSTLFECLPTILVGIGQLIVEICKALPDLLKALGIALTAPFREWWNFLKGFFTPVIEWLSTNVIEPMKSVFADLWEKLKEVWDGICTVVKVAFELIGSIISAAFDIITLPFRFIWENCKEYVFIAWDFIKEKVTTAINAVKTVITNVMNAIKAFLEPILNAIKSVFSTVWNAIKTAVTTAVNAVKSVITRVFNAVKSTVTSIFNAIKSTVTNVWNSIKTKITTVTDSIKNKVSTVFNKVKTSITKPIKEAKDKVKEYVDKIKGFFDGFTAKIKLPHFTIKNASLNPKDWIKNGVPKLSVEWYKDGGIFTEGIMERPTAFGISSNGALRVGGEAGAEAVAPISKLQEYVAIAATQGNAELAEKLDTLISLLTLYLPLLMKKELMLDTGALVGELVNPLNKALGDLTRQRERGRA